MLAHAPKPLVDQFMGVPCAKERKSQRFDPLGGYQPCAKSDHLLVLVLPTSIVHVDTEVDLAWVKPTTSFLQPG